MSFLRTDFYINTEFSIVYEDKDIIVINKPAPLPVHSVGSYGEKNLLSILRMMPEFKNIELKTPHRLDAETSGILVLAKTEDAAKSLSRQFSESKVEKIYKAIVFGSPPEIKGIISASLGYDESSPFALRKVVDRGETALTEYRLVSSSERYSIIELHPLTGRTHQLRVHCSFIGCPIVGDKLYIDPSLFLRYASGGIDDLILERLKLPRLALHAVSIKFFHPSLKKEVSYNAPLPEMLIDFALKEGLYF